VEWSHCRNVVSRGSFLRDFRRRSLPLLIAKQAQRLRCVFDTAITRSLRKNSVMPSCWRVSSDAGKLSCVGVHVRRGAAICFSQSQPISCHFAENVSGFCLWLAWSSTIIFIPRNPVRLRGPRLLKIPRSLLSRFCLSSTDRYASDLHNGDSFCLPVRFSLF